MKNGCKFRRKHSMILQSNPCDKNLTPRTRRPQRWGKTKLSISKTSAPFSDGFLWRVLCIPLRPSRPLRDARILSSAWIRFRACLKSLRSECGPSSATAMANEQVPPVSSMPFAVPHCCARGRAHSVRIWFRATVYFQTGSQSSLRLLHSPRA